MPEMLRRRSVKWIGGAALLVALLAAGTLVYTQPVAVFQAWAGLRLRLHGVRSASVQAGPYRLHYLEAGSGPPLLLVHGLGSNATQDWGRLIPITARHFRVLAPDLPGFGDSDKPPAADYSIRMQVAAVRAFMDAEGIRRARVAGLSMGGWIAARLAGEHPEQVERLVVVDAAGMKPDRPDIPAEVLLPTDEDGVRALVAAVRYKAPAPPAFLARDILRYQLRQRWVVQRALESMRDGNDWLNGTLGRATMPVLVVWGRQDALIPLAYGKGLAAEFPSAELRVLDGCGHVPMADCPAAFDAAFVPFLADGPGPGAEAGRPPG
jgi:pimeloyl-ACP methyl ester carboxylesterase